jgi:hypothetical protein
VEEFNQKTGARDTKGRLEASGMKLCAIEIP